MSALLGLSDLSVQLGGRYVVDGVSLVVQPGEVIALLGANGAGKTSLIRAGLGLIVLSRGQAFLGGSEARALSTRQRALRAAYLPQRPQAIWPLSVARLVALGRYAYGAAPDRLGEADRGAVDAALHACALESLRDRGMDTLSGGEKARAHLARALAQKAPLLVLDEPTAGLDPAQALGVAEILAAQARSGGGVVFSTHEVSLAARCAHRILLMKDGRALALGAPAEALTPELLEAAYGRKALVDWRGGACVASFG
jgi:iron complex transport system ATP-binding protein